MVSDKQGNQVTIRLAVPADRAQVVSSISDQTGTGSGTGNDDFLLQQFDCMVADPDVLLLFAEDARHTGLGMLAIAYSSDSESYWKMLRVAEVARQRGIASILFRAAAKAALDRQGPMSVSRWGIVSNNTTMLEWSRRLALSGPQAFRRHSSTASATTPALPSAYEIRAACEADIPCIMERLPKTVGNSVFGAQNFVWFVTEREGWAEFSESILRACIAGVKIDGIQSPAPRLLFDDKGDPVAFASFAFMNFGGKRLLVHGYVDGTPEGLELLINQMPAIAHEYGCDATDGYVPVLPWLLAIFERSPFYTRSTATEQLVFRWKNAEFASTVELDHK